MKSIAKLIWGLMIIIISLLFINAGCDKQESEKTEAELKVIKQNLEQTQVELKDIKTQLTQNKIELEKNTQAAKPEDKIIQAAKDVLAKNKDAIVTVRLVLKMKASFGGQDIGAMMGGQEQKVEANGTIVDPSGLTIISATQTNPSSMFDGLNIGGGEEGEGRSIKSESSVISVKIVLNDGKELPASIVLNDKDLDLAFVQPEEKNLNLPYLKLEKTATPNILDEVIMISRLDFSTGREPLISCGSISAIVKKPRTHYLIMGGPLAGSPAFNIEGQCLGIGLTRSTGAKKAMSLLNASNSAMDMMPMVLPSEDIIEVMKQVPPVKEK
ncbi:MAG: trypsin-like peptidase domain-containing protein [Planctomycetota bacterium]